MRYLPDDRLILTKAFMMLPASYLAIPNLHVIGYADYRETSRLLETHYHHTMECNVILSGSQRYAVGERSFLLHGGDMFTSHPREPHGNGGVFQEICESIWFQFALPASEEQADGFLGLCAPHDRLVYRAVARHRQRITRIEPKSLALLRKAFFCFASDAPRERLRGYACFLQFVADTFCREEPEPVSDCTEDIAAAVAYLDAHLFDAVAIDAVARHVGLCVSHFKVKFKAQMGVTPHHYLLSAKIAAAKSMLETPDCTVTEIAARLQFASSSHFASVFKRFTGFTPTAYRSGKKG